MKIISCSALAVAACSYGCGQSHATTLVWQFPQSVGARYEVRTFLRSSTQQNKPMVRFQMRFDAKSRSSEGKQQHFVLKSESTTLEICNFSIDVLQRTSKGLKCRLTLRNWRMNLSEKENGKSSELWTTWNKSVLPVSKIITGSSFTFLLKVGQVSEIRGLEALRNKLMLAAKARRNIELANVAENRFNELYWHSLLNQWTEGTSAKVLQKGSQWHFTRPASLWSWQPVTISRTVTNLSRNSATLQDSAILDVDTTPRKSQHFRDTAIYAWKYKGSYQNDWFLNQSKGWILQSSEIMQWRGNALIYGASKQGDLSLLSDTPTTFREETRLVATRLR